jgi:periplasmic divalent cation tolerance protein
MAESEFIAILITAGSAEEADVLAQSLVSDRLVACVNVVGPIRSIYRWQGAVERAEEHLLIAKTRRALFDAVSTRVHELHSYTTPEVIALPIDAGAPNYLAWLADSTSL